MRGVKEVIEILRDERGQGMAEYGLIIALVAIAAILALTFLGNALKAKFQNTAETLESAQP